MKYLITGGAGFIGSHLVEKLLREKHKVTVIDNFSTGKQGNLPVHQNLSVYKDTILSDETKPIYKGQDIVIHLAAYTRPRESFTNPIETNRVNVEGTLKVILNSKEAKVKKFIFTSSASIYGFKDVYPLFHTANPEPASPYAISKLTGEHYSFLLGKPMKVNIIRPFNVFGRRQDPNGPYAAAVPNFIKYLKEGNTPFITGNGEQFRDFIHVSDVVYLIYKISQSPLSDQIFNLGSGESTTINKLYQIISKVMQKRIDPGYIKPIKEPNTKADMTPAKYFFRWKPKFSLEEGIREMI